MITNVAISLVLGLLVSLLAQFILRHLLGIRTNWLLTAVASLLTSGVFGLCFALTTQNFDPKASFYLGRVLACAIGAAAIAGLVGFRFNIHGDHGDHPSWGAAFGLTALVIAPNFVVLTLLHLVST